MSGSMTMRQVSTELARGVDLDDLAVDGHVGDVHPACGTYCLHRLAGEPAVSAAEAQIVHAAAAVAVTPRPLRLRDRVPDRLRRSLDVDAIDLCGDHRVGRHAVSSPSTPPPPSPPAPPHTSPSFFF